MVFLAQYNSVKSLTYSSFIFLFLWQQFVFRLDEGGVPLSVAICSTAFCRISTATGAGLKDFRTVRRFWLCVSIFYGLHCCVRGRSKVLRTTDDPTPWHVLDGNSGSFHGGTPKKKLPLSKQLLVLFTQLYKVFVKQRNRFNPF